MTSLIPFSKTLKLGRVIYADKGIIVVNKASGLVCQSERSRRNERISNFDQLLLSIKAQLGMSAKPIQVHRLDKLTTGALLLARTSQHARDLHSQLQARDVHKTYLAIVRGGAKTFEKARSKSGNGRIMGIVEKRVIISEDGVRVGDEDKGEGEEAVTEWELLGSSDKAPLSLVRLRPLTGRKHQLRLHLAHVLQSPILGDMRYSTKIPHEDILQLIPRGVDVLGPSWHRHDSLGVDSDKDPLILTRRERMEVKRKEKKRLHDAEREHRMFLHSSNVSLHRYTTTPTRRLRLGVTAPLPSYFLAFCEAANLRRFVPEECVMGGLTVDGQTVDLGVPVGGDKHDNVIEGLSAMWYGLQ